MALQVINVRYEVDTAQLEEARRVILQNAQAAGMSEEEAKKVANAYASQVSALKTVTKEVRKEQDAIEDAAEAADKLGDSLNQSDAEAGIKKTTTAVKRLGNEADKAGKKAKTSRSRFDFSQVLNFAGASVLAGGLAGVVSGVTQTVVQLGTAASEANRNLEQQLVTFRTLLQGTGETAEEVVGRLTELSVSTPFTPDQVIEAGKALLAFGEPVDTLEDSLSRIGDIASGTGKDFNELSLIYGKARVAGTLFAEDINQLTEAGVPIIELFAEQLGVTNAEVKKLASDGKISFSNLETAFQDLTNEGGRFFNLTAAQSQTLAGRISTLQGQFNALLTSAGGPINRVLGVLVDTLSGLITRFDEVTVVFDPLIAAFDRLSIEFNALLDSLGIVIPEFNLLETVLTSLRFVGSLAAKQYELLVGVFRLIVAEINAVVSVGRAVIRSFRDIAAASDQLIASIKSLNFRDFANQIREIFTSNFGEVEAENKGRRIVASFNRGIQQADSAAALENFRNAIQSQLDAGLISESQAKKLQDEVTERLNQIAREAAIQAAQSQTTTSSTAASSSSGSRSTTAGQSESERLKAEAAALREKEAAAAALKREQEALIKQQIESGQRLVEVDENRFTEAVERISANLRRSIIEQDQLLNQVLSNEATTAEERVAIEEQVNRRKIELNRQAAADILAESRRVAQENAAVIANLEFQGGIGGLDAGQTAELDARRALQIQLNADLLAAEEALTAATLQETQNRVDQQVAIESEKRDKLNAIASNISNFGGKVLSTVSEIFEAQAARQVAAAEGNERKQKEIQLRAFRRQKAIRIGEAIINGTAAAVRAFADLGPIGGAIAAVLIAARTAAQIAKISSEQPPAFSTGVFDLDGKGTGTSDSILARLSRGESVMRSETTRRHPVLLKGLHDGRKLYQTSGPGGERLWSFDKKVSRAYAAFNPDVKTGAEVRQLEKMSARLTIGNTNDGLASAIARELTAGEYDRNGLRWRNFVTLKTGIEEILKRLDKS